MILAKQIDEKEGALMDPIRFNMWLAIIGSTMLFAAFTSAYIVKRAEGNWDAFPIPEQFIFSTVLVILGSISMQWSLWAAKRDELVQMRTALICTVILAIAFGISQFMGWSAMVESGLFLMFTDNVAGSFFYVITGMHFLHVAGGFIAVGRVVYKAFKLEIHKKSLRAISMSTTYWHFMGILWIYLYLFLFLNR